MKEFPAWEIHILTSYIKKLIESDHSLQNIWVRGEVSNFKKHSSGHMYFSLKDELSSIRCVMFRSRAGALRFSPKNGDRVLIRGSISVYERDGSYQLYVDEMQSDGVGDLHHAYELLKKRLESEGLFDQGRKLSLPFLPQTIGVVTSPTGAAIRDIISVLRRRFENISIILAPVRVQGGEAPEEIAKAIRDFNALGKADVIIVGRGGGSFEELNAFNSEIVARSIFDSSIPIISAVGHETDFTIADFVSDMRAPTPSAAAEIVVPDKRELMKSLSATQSRFTYLLRRKHEVELKRLGHLSSRPVISKPKSTINQNYQDVDVLLRRGSKQILNLLGLKKERFRTVASLLNSLSPLRILERGYSLCTEPNTNMPIRSIQVVKQNMKVKVTLYDGMFIGCVEQISREDQ